MADVLWLPREASIESVVDRWAVTTRNGRIIHIDGTADVVFGIEADPEDLSQRIVNHFAAPDWDHFATLVWRPRQMQYLNPQLPTSFVVGWLALRGGGGRPQPGDVDPAVANEPVRTWHGEWEDDRGNLITYDLRGQGRKLRGMAVYLPKLVVDESRRRFGR